MPQEMLSTATIASIAATIAQELKVKPSQVETSIRLMEEGATVPFIARYRKEATEGLDDGQLRTIALRLYYLKELEARRKLILDTIREKGQLTESLEKAILNAQSKTQLEDYYLPFRPKKRNKADDAKKAGLLPLALSLKENPSLDPEAEAQSFIDAEKGVPDSKTALDGARCILMELFAEDANLLHELREYLWNHMILKANKSPANPKANKSKKNAKREEEENKYKDYFDYKEPIKKVPSHRALALFRARKENILQLSLHLLDEEDANYGLKKLAISFQIHPENRPADNWLQDTLQATWKQKLLPKLEQELYARLRESADDEAIRVFSRNLRDLLLAAPAGSKTTMGLDPGLRTGVKIAVVDATGKFLDYTTIFPFASQNERHQALTELARLTAKYNVDLFSIGNGTGSRETERLVVEMMKMYPDMRPHSVLVSEAGASVYSASELAADEFPDLDVSIRGAVSIARRLQNPLAELVKIEPKAIGVGQYQHDINQGRLHFCLEGIVEDCVNQVGVDLNTASIALLTKVSGLNASLAKNLVEYRNTHGAFTNREQLKLVSRMGEKSFQQSAGFLRILQGDNPLDASSVHPEAYPLVDKIRVNQNSDLQTLIGNKDLLESVNASLFVDEHYGLPTIRDVLKELEKPGRDPRPEFRTVQFKEGIEDIEHLQVGMVLEGVVSNVTNFGAFVNIGVHQDGLVHISSMGKGFVSSPHSLIKAGDIILVKVIEIDQERRRIGLSMKLEEEKKGDVAVKKMPVKKNERPRKPLPLVKKEAPKPAQKSLFNTAMADAFNRLKNN